MWKLKLKDETEVIINEGACVDEFITEETNFKEKLTDENLLEFEIQDMGGNTLANVSNMTLDEITEEEGVSTVKLKVVDIQQIRKTVSEVTESAAENDADLLYQICLIQMGVSEDDVE